MLLSRYQMRMKILILESVSPFSKGGKGGFEFFLLRHCEEHPMRRGNLIHLLSHSEERILLRENPVL